MFVEGECGVGKSVIALAAHALNYPYRTVILTASYDLQRQYQRAYPDGFTAYGRPAFRCILSGFEKYRVSEAPCSGGYSCPHVKPEEGLKQCPYFIQRDALVDKPIVFTNYSYFIYGRRASLFHPGPALLICDEAHLLEGFLVQSATLDLTELPGTPPPDDAQLRGWLLSVAADLQHEAETITYDNPEDYLLPGSPAYLERLAGDCTRTAREQGWIREGNLIRPIWPKEQFRQTIGLIPKVVILSATPPSASVFGIDKHDYIAVPLDFDRKAQAPVYYDPVVRLNYKNLRQELPKVISEVDRIISQHPGERGLIHTHKHDISMEVLASSRYAHEMISHGRAANSRRNALAMFRRGDKRILVSASMTSGVDLPHDQCRFVIWVKTPWPDLGDAVVAERFRDNPGWYEDQTAITTAQGLGRGMRSTDDHCDGYILDGSAGRILRRMPGWMRESLVYVQ